ncbi:MAG: gliding motility-associated C-terminal domain-containing protein [Flavobacteriales bacterium]|nr:gliding motility-associated C-terminal domain-containing protein [Flavobacteriales bacterium]
MKYLFVTFFFLLPFSAYAQCGLEVSSTTNLCLSSEVTASIGLTAPSEAVWDISPKEGVVEGVVEGSAGKEYYATFENAGDYQITSISEACSEVYNFTVYPKTDITTNIKSDYYLCDGILELDFQILNANDFISSTWEFENNLYNTTSLNLSFTEPVQKDVLLRVTDQNECFDKKTFAFTINDGPVLEDITTERIDAQEGCVASGLDYTLRFSHESSYSNSYLDPVEFPIQTSVNGDILSENFSIPLSISFDNSECVINTQLDYSHDIAHNVSFDTNYDGVLCSDESITLTNSSAHKSDASNFSWSGIPAGEVVSSSSNAITFIPATEGDYTVQLDYTGICSSSYSSPLNVRLDYIDPVLTENINRFTCDFSLPTELSDMTELANQRNDYNYLWSIIPENGAWDASETLTSTNPAASLLLASSDAQSYDLTLLIENSSTGCSGSKIFADYFSIGGPVAEINSSTIKYCGLKQINTADLTPMNKVNDLDYNWSFKQNNIEQASNDSFSSLIQLDEFGAYDVSLNVKSQDGCESSDSVDDMIVFNEYTTTINTPPNNICFNGNPSVIYEFTAMTVPASTAYAYVAGSESWELTLPDGSKEQLVSSTPFESINPLEFIESKTSYDFTIPGTYTITYFITFDGENEICSYQDSKTFDVGLNAEITEPSIICVGNEFDILLNTDNPSNVYQYDWTASSGLTIDNASSALPKVSAGIQPEQSTQQISLRLTNSNGCWTEVSKSIEVYDVVADFNVSKSILYCTDQNVEISSLNNDRIASWIWTIEETNSTTNQIKSDPNFTHRFTDAGQSTVSLKLISEEGCENTKSIENAVLTNTFTTNLEPVPDNICFDGAQSVSQEFIANTVIDLDKYSFNALGDTWELVLPDGSVETPLTIAQTYTPFIKSTSSYDFTVTGEYTIRYIFTYTSGNDFCRYQDSQNFFIGLNTEIISPEAVCDGEDFEVSIRQNTPVDEANNYQWSVGEGLSLSDPFSANPKVSIDEFYAGDSQINLMLSNPNGCTANLTKTVEIYDVSADFTASDTILYCNGEEVAFESLNNNRINTWEWTFQEPNLSPVNTDGDSLITRPFTEMGFSDVGLKVTSFEGCSDFKLYEEMILLNNYIISIDPIPENICFNGEERVSQNFIARTIPEFDGYDYIPLDESWELTLPDGTKKLLGSNSNLVSGEALSEALVSNSSYEFELSGLYTLNYRVSIDGLFDICLFEDSKTFRVGIEAEIESPIAVCLGEAFEVSVSKDDFSDSYDYMWTLGPGLIVDDSSKQSPLFNTMPTSLEGSNMSLKLTNAEGCWIIDTVDVEVKQVIADFVGSDSLLLCSGQDFKLTSLNNDNIESWDWQLFVHDNDAVIPDNSSTNTNPQFSLEPLTAYGVSLKTTNNIGCTDLIYRDSVVVVDDLEMTIQDVDGVVCFDNKSTIDKHYQINYQSVLNTPLNVTDFNWSIEPNIPLIEDQGNIRFVVDEPKVYELTCELIVDNGDEAPCVYQTSKKIQFGVKADLNLPEIVCVGEDFPISADLSVGIGEATFFSWISNDEFIIEDPQATGTYIKATDSSAINQTVFYPLSMSVTNDLGCSLQKDTTIEVYRLFADFEASNTGDICAFKPVNLNSLNNDFVSSFSWSSTGKDYQGGNLPDPISSNETSEVDFFYTEMGIYDVTLEVNSVHGCADQMTKNSLYEVKRPYPKFTFESDYGCDGTIVKIIDESEFSSDIKFQFLSYDPVTDVLATKVYDSVNYVLNETNEIEFSFPYSKTQDLYMEYPIALNALLGQCAASFKDTLTIYPNPIIDIVITDSIGCPPFEVGFENNSSFFDLELSSFVWDIGNAVVNENFQNTNLYDTAGEYDVYHSITSENGCFSDTLIPEKIKVFDNPVASFDYATSDLCFNAPVVSFNNNSSYETDSISSLWTFNSVSKLLDDNSSYTQEFDSSGVYDIELFVTDMRGCTDESIQSVDIVILNDIVTKPEIAYVSVEDTGIELYWSGFSIDSNFKSLEIYHRTLSRPWEEISLLDDLNNLYLHDSVNKYELNQYSILQFDSCGFSSDTSLVHSTIFLETQSTDYQTMDLSWTPYVGWEEVLRYDIFRSDDGLKYKLVDTVAGDVSFYTDTNLCNTSYTHYVLAHHPNGVYKSNSNVSKSKEPLFIDFTQPLNLVRTTVVNDQYLTTEWDEFYTHEMTYYNIHRWDEYFGWISDYSAARDSLFVDVTANPKGRRYKYRASYADECGNEGPNSGIGANILLKGVQFPEHYYLHWNPYEDWEEGVRHYTLQYYNSDDSSYVNLKTLSNSTFEYTDQDLVKNGIDTSYCYRVVAQSMSNNYSISNDFCFVPSPKKYFPNAFTPDGDGVNDHYSYSGLFGKAIEVNIYDRWGSLVFTSNDIDFVWDGTYNNSGKYCPMGTYIMEFELVGFDGTVIRDQTSIVLYR